MILESKRGVIFDGLWVSDLKARGNLTNREWNDGSRMMPMGVHGRTGMSEESGGAVSLM